MLQWKVITNTMLRELNKVSAFIAPKPHNAFYADQNQVQANVLSRQLDYHISSQSLSPTQFNWGKTRRPW